MTSDRGGVCAAAGARQRDVRWGRSLRVMFCVHGRPRIGADGVICPPPGKMDEKLKSENMQKEQFSVCVYVIF